MIPGPASQDEAAADPAGVAGPAAPDARLAGLPARSRGVIALLEENCTVCMLCARECPDWCIYIESHKETVPAPDGGRPRVRNVLDRFAIDFSLCMYCGICVEACPYDARKISKLIRDEGPKGVRAQVQGDELRVSSKKKDDLQAVIALVRGNDFGLALQFVNFR